jgi:N-acetylneuraminic acid mutarotase
MLTPHRAPLALLAAVLFCPSARAAEVIDLTEPAPVLDPSNLTEVWQPRATPRLAGRSANTAVWTGKEMITFGGEGMGISFGDGARYNPATDTWHKLPTTGEPATRTGHTAVWTGQEMIIWGGFGGQWGNDFLHDNGARYNPESDSWKPVSKIGAPEARFDHSAVWTGKEMLIWGGYTDSHARYNGAHTEAFVGSGGRYDPATDSWRPITMRGAPSKRCWHTAVWTGTEMIVWGGGNSEVALNDGARYNPLTDTWTPMRSKCPLSPRASHVAVWIGSTEANGCPGGEMLVWGGGSRDDAQEYFTDGARYNPATDTWTPMSNLGAPRGRVITRAVWTGSEMVFWGGVNDSASGDTRDLGRYVGSGGRYNPATDTWHEISRSGAPAPRLVTGVVWTGTTLLLSGGYNGTHLSDTYSYSLTPSP